MTIHNVHARRFPVPAQRLGELLDTLSSGEDRLWPGDEWPPMWLDRPLAPGAAGGHGPVRYFVEEAVPGQRVRFRFTAPRGLDGHHEFTVVPHGEEACELRHVLAGTLSGTALLTWPLFWRPLHDAALEQLLDRAELALTGRVAVPSVWSPYVRFLHAIASRARVGAPTP